MNAGEAEFRRIFLARVEERNKGKKEDDSTTEELTTE